MRVLMVGIALLVLLLMDGTNASRYCSYHPEAPECRGKQARYQVLSDWEVETEADPAVGHEMRQNVEAEISATVSSSNAAGAAVINSTSIAIESLLPQQDDVHVEDDHVVAPAADVPASPTALPSSMEVHGVDASATQSQAAGWLLLFNTHQGRVVLEALGAVGAALVMFGVLAKLWAHRLAQQIDALDDVALGEALRRKCDAASPFAVVVDAVSGSSSVADLRRRLEAKLARLCEQRQTALEAKATRLAERVDVADRKHQFAQQWRNVHAKSLPISELEALLAQAEEVNSEFEKVIREWLEFRHQIERESTTLRLTMGDSGDGYAALTRSTELRLLAADARANLRGRHSDDSDDDSDNDNDDLVTNISCEQHNHKEKKKKKKKKMENEEEDDDDDDEHNTRPLVRSAHEGGERSAAKRRSTSGPLGARVLEDYGRDYDSPIARELSRQNDTESKFRAMELFYKLEKQRKKQEHKIQKQQKREEENEVERGQALHRLKERQRANQIKQEKLDNQKREARKASEAVESLAAWSGLKTKLIVHASIYGGIALYHLWHGLLDSWRSALDFSSACTPAIPRLINEVCLPDLTAYLPLHILLPVLLCFLVLAVQWGGLLLQLPSLAGLCLLLVAVWGKVPSPLDFVGLVGVVVVQLLVFAGQRAIAGSPGYDDDVDGGGQPRRSGVLGAVLALAEVLLFVVNIGLALACFARRRNDASHDSFTDCFATPSDFGSCYTYY